MGAQPTLRSVSLIVCGRVRVRDLGIFFPVFLFINSHRKGVFMDVATKCPIIESHKNDWET